MSAADTVFASLKQSFAELRGHFEEVGECFHREFQSLDHLCGDFLEFSRHLERSHQHLQVVESHLVEQQRQAQQAALCPTEDPSTLQTLQSENEELAERVRALEKERNQLEAELHLGRAWSEERESLVRQLAESQEEIQNLRAQPQCQDVQRRAAGDASTPPADPRLEQLEAERTALEHELDDVRNRAAALAESLADQQRQLLQEREEWSNEMRELRRVLELQAKQLAAQEEHRLARDRAMEAHPRLSEPANHLADDMILGSVMAQFEMLQRDKIGRRERAQAGA